MPGTGESEDANMDNSFGNVNPNKSTNPGMHQSDSEDSYEGPPGTKRF